MIDAIPVTELVEMRLLNDFDSFRIPFETQCLPILLRAPGMISVQTGPKLEAGDYLAVSITQWESLQAHRDFLKSAAAPVFFERVGSITAGPPIVAHYDLGDLRSVKELQYVHIYKSSASEGAAISTSNFSQDRSMPMSMGKCVEDESLSVMLRFFSSREAMQTVVDREFHKPETACSVDMQIIGVPSRAPKL